MEDAADIVDCESCDGTGVIDWGLGGVGPDAVEKPCQDCKGEGVIDLSLIKPAPKPRWSF